MQAWVGWGFALSALWAALGGAACRSRSPAQRVAPPTAGLAAPASAAPSRTAPSSALEPLSGNWLEPLPLDDAGLAYVTPPLGAREPRPLMVAVHGAGDRPEWACGGWRLAANGYAFVVCPRGLPMDAQRFGWDNGAGIARRVAQAISAVKARYGPYIASGPTLYLGFSQGATLARSVLLAEPGRFPAVALAEGGYDLVRDANFLTQLRERGTTRALIVCGSAACFTTAHAVIPALARVGIEASAVGNPLSGHNLNQRMQTALQAAWPSFVRGLPNWNGFAEHIAARQKP
ncbi:MAG: hypothetical protein QM756_36670 [Polyangiaceae bacterium]